MSAGGEMTNGGDKSTGRFFAKNRRYIADISATQDKSAILSKNRLRIPCVSDLSYIADFLAIFGEKSPLFLQRDLTAQITLVLIQRPDLNPNVNK